MGGNQTSKQPVIHEVWQEDRRQQYALQNQIDLFHAEENNRRKDFERYCKHMANLNDETERLHRAQMENDLRGYQARMETVRQRHKQEMQIIEGKKKELEQWVKNKQQEITAVMLEKISYIQKEKQMIELKMRNDKTDRDFEAKRWEQDMEASRAQSEQLIGQMNARHELLCQEEDSKFYALQERRLQLEQQEEHQRLNLERQLDQLRKVGEEATEYFRSEAQQAGKITDDVLQNYNQLLLKSRHVSEASERSSIPSWSTNSRSAAKARQFEANYLKHLPSTVSAEQKRTCATIFADACEKKLQPAVKDWMQSLIDKGEPLSFQKHSGCSEVCPLIAFLQGADGKQGMRLGQCECEHPRNYRFQMDYSDPSKMKVVSFAPHVANN